jgi:hypothetical protein
MGTSGTEQGAQEINVVILVILVYYLFMSFSTIFLLKNSNRFSLLLPLIFIFGGILMCKWLEDNYNPFPFGLEWVPYIFYIKLIFAFTLQYKK